MLVQRPTMAAASSSGIDPVLGDPSTFARSLTVEVARREKLLGSGDGGRVGVGRRETHANLEPCGSQQSAERVDRR